MFGTVLLAALSLPLFVACAPSQAPAPQTAEPNVAPGISRDLAIQQAQTDAANQYSGVAFSPIQAQKLNGFWVVELLSATGGGIRYTISASDGSIRGRSTFLQ